MKIKIIFEKIEGPRLIPFLAYGLINDINRFDKKMLFTLLDNWFHSGSMEKLHNVILVVNSFTECQSYPVDSRVWRICRKNNPSLRVHFLTEGKRPREVNFQEGAPVKSIVYDSTNVKVNKKKSLICVHDSLVDIWITTICQQRPLWIPPDQFFDWLSKLRVMKCHYWDFFNLILIIKKDLLNNNNCIPSHTIVPHLINGLSVLITFC